MKIAGSKLAGMLLLAFVALVAMSTPVVASSGVTLAEAQPWHYWIAFVLFASALGVVLIALPVGYYLKVWRLKHRGR